MPKKERNMGELDHVFQSFAARRSQRSYEMFLLSFVLHARDGKRVAVPVSVEAGGQLTCGLVATTDGLYYSVFTSGEEVSRCPEMMSAVMRLDNVIELALCDPESSGICVNPGNPSPCFFPREYILTILDATAADEECSAS